MGIAFGFQAFRPRLRGVMVVLAVGLSLAACGRGIHEAREPWRSELEGRCMASGAVQMSRFVERARPINGPGVCGMDQPLRVHAQSRGSVAYAQPQTLACPMVPTVDRWIENVVQPAAQRWFGATVVEVKAGSYSCRAMRGASSGRASEHSFGNALDVFAFVLSSGHTVTVRQHWRGEGADTAFLRDIFVRACDLFTTVLGPGADAFHYDHFHLDLARHDPRWERRVCRPRPETVQIPQAQPAGIGFGFGQGQGQRGFGLFR